MTPPREQVIFRGDLQARMFIFGFFHLCSTCAAVYTVADYLFPHWCFNINPFKMLILLWSARHFLGIKRVGVPLSRLTTQISNC